MSSLLSILLLLLKALSFAVAKTIDVVQLPCGVRISKAEMSEKMKPAEITPENYASLILAMRACGIDKAQVAGWNGDKGDFVLYSNGCVVPAEDLTLPTVALYIEVCGCEPHKVVCVYKPEGDAKCECFAVTEVKQPPLEAAAEGQSKCFNTAISTKKKILTQTCCSRTKTKCGIESLRTVSSRIYIFEETPEGKGVLKVRSQKKMRKEEIIMDTGKSITLHPSLMNDPQALYKLQKRLRKKFNQKISLYVSTAGLIFAKACKLLLQVSICGKDMTTKTISLDDLSKLDAGGLIGVEFRPRPASSL